MDRTGSSRASRRVVAAGLLVALAVLVAIGRAERQALSPRVTAPAPLVTSAPTTTIPPAPVTARIGIGRGAGAVAVGEGGVWALRGGSVVRVDPRGDRVTARIRVAAAAGFWDGRFALGAGALWVGAGDHAIRVDPGSGRVGRVRAGAWAVGPDGLWSCRARAEGGRGSLVRVDPRTLAETARVPVAACPAALVAGRGVAWAVDERGTRVLRVAADGRVTAIGLPVAPFSLSPTGPVPVALAVGEGAVWALSDRVESPTRLGSTVGLGLVRIDPGSARVTGVTPLADLEAADQAFAVGAGGVWVVGTPVGQRGSLPGRFVVDRVDPRSGRLLGSFAVGGLELGFGPQVAVGFGALWLAAFDSSELLRIDLSRM